MKRRALLVFAMTSAVLAGCAQAPPPVSDTVQKYYDEHKTASAAAPKKDFRSVAVIGDSFVTGSGMGGNDAANWTQLVAKALSTDQRTVQLQKAGLAGSGYVTRGPTGKIFIDVVSDAINRDTSLIVFYGSINDIGVAPRTVSAAADAAFAAAKTAAPTAKILVFGPAWPHQEKIAELTADRDAVKASAAKAGATFVDPFVDGWFQGDASHTANPEGLGPSLDGYCLECFSDFSDGPHCQGCASVRGWVYCIRIEIGVPRAVAYGCPDMARS